MGSGMEGPANERWDGCAAGLLRAAFEQFAETGAASEPAGGLPVAANDSPNRAGAMGAERGGVRRGKVSYRVESCDRATVVDTIWRQIGRAHV